MPQLPYIYFGDSEALVIKMLSESAEMQALNPTAISDNLIGYNYETDKWVEVTLQGGSFRYFQQKRPRIDIITYAPLREDAFDLATTAQAVMFAYAGTNYTAFGLTMVAVQVETDLFRSSDKMTNSVQYIQALRLILKSTVVQ